MFCTKNTQGYTISTHVINPLKWLKICTTIYSLRGTNTRATVYQKITKVATKVQMTMSKYKMKARSKQTSKYCNMFLKSADSYKAYNLRKHTQPMRINLGRVWMLYDFNRADPMVTGNRQIYIQWLYRHHHTGDCHRATTRWVCRQKWGSICWADPNPGW